MGLSPTQDAYWWSTKDWVTRSVESQSITLERTMDFSFVDLQARDVIVNTGMGFIGMASAVWLAGLVVALKQKPEWRALWTAAPAYVVAVLIIYTVEEYPSWLTTAMQLPSAILIHLWLFHTYRKAWINDDEIPEGTRLENSDWRVGLIPIAAILGMVLGNMTWRVIAEILGYR